MKKLRVAVLAGGKSAEHEISVASAKEIIKHLNPQKYEALPVYISKDGLSWQILDGNQFATLPTPIRTKTKRYKPRTLSIEKVAENGIEKIKEHGVDIVFIALHGPYGEDGTVQGFLELFGIPYTGSGVLASALGMDKVASRKIFENEGLNVPKHIALRKGYDERIIWSEFDPPVFTKPHDQGSSIGSNVVHSKEELANRLAEAFLYSEVALVEEYLDGDEVTCGVLGNDNPETFPLVEICPKNEFFDFEAKYNESMCDEIVPARLPKNIAKKAQETAVIAYKSIGCKAFARVDMIIKDEEPHILEINTIPGLTLVSLVPKAAKAAGISYPKLLDKIITYSLE